MTDDINLKLDKILAQAELTNGRVTVLESEMSDVKDVLYGDPQRNTAGLVAQSQAVDAMLRQWYTLAKAAKWLIAAFGTSALALLANLLGR